MSESERRQQALQLIADTSERDISKIQPQMHLMVDLEIDSPKALDLLMNLEEAFGFEIDDDEAAGLETVQDILDLVQQRGS